MKELNKILLVLLLIWGSSPILWADYDHSKPKPSNITKPSAIAAKSGCAPPSDKKSLEINNVRALIKNAGHMWFDGSTPKYEVPKTTDPTDVKRSSIFAGGIWVGGVDRSDSSKVLVQAEDYAQSGQITFWAGPIDSIVTTTSADRCLRFDHLYEARKVMVRQFLADFNAGLIRSSADVPELIRNWPARNNAFLLNNGSFAPEDLDFDLAPFIDADNDHNYNPLNGDYPRLTGDKFKDPNPKHTRGLPLYFDKSKESSFLESGADQMFWYVLNDVGGVKNFGNSTTGDPIGLEIHTEAFAYATADAVNNMTFYRQFIINKSNKGLNKCWFGQFVDPDIGYSGDDYVQVNVPRGLGIAYNGEDNDPGVTGYGDNPPSIGVDFFIGPEADPGDLIDNNKNGTTDEPGEKIILSNFASYNNSSGNNGNPSIKEHFYYFLQSRWQNGKHVTFDGKAGISVSTTANPLPPYNFIYPGTSDMDVCWGLGGLDIPGPRKCQWNKNGTITPFTPVEWSERTAQNPPGDRRFISSAGPFTLQPGKVNELTIGVVWARATSGGAIGSFESLLIADDLAQALFDRDFEIIAGPSKPQLTVTELNGSLILSWPDVNNNIENYKVLDPAQLDPSKGDPNYYFQGYIIYQVSSDQVSASELDNPDKARIIAQCDIKDKIDKVSNLVYSESAGKAVEKVMVNGANKGLFHTLEVKTDVFNNQYDKLLNNKKYYFVIVAYATNASTDPKVTNHFLVNRLGDGEGLVSVAVPHLIDEERNGTVLHSKYGDLVQFTRLKGTGTGGLVLDSIEAADESSILANNSQLVLRYKRNYAPLSVKVYNPKRLTKRGTYQIELSSRLSYKYDGSLPLPAVGDTLLSNYSIPVLPPAPQGNDLFSNDVDYSLYYGEKQIPGKAVVKRVLYNSGDTIVNLDVRMINDQLGGTFDPTVVKSAMKYGDAASVPSALFSGYSTLSEIAPCTTGYTIKSGNSVVGGGKLIFNPPTFTNKSTNKTYPVGSFQPYDYWRLWDLANPTQYIYNKSLNSVSDEELLSDLGLSIKVNLAKSPATRAIQNRRSGYISFKIDYKDPAKAWLQGIGNGIAKWTNSSDYDANYDPSGLYTSMTCPNCDSGIVAPYAAASTPAQSNGSSFKNSSVYFNLQNLQNVDVVYTKDTSLWTRCPVFNYDMRKVIRYTILKDSTFKATVFNGCTNIVKDSTIIFNLDSNTYVNPGLNLNLSLHPSVDKNGNVTSESTSFSFKTSIKRRVIDSLNNCKIISKDTIIVKTTKSIGMGWFPGYAIDLDRGIRLNMAFTESAIKDPTTYQKNGETRVRGNDLIFDISQFPERTQSFFYVMYSQYDKGIAAEKSLDSIYAAYPIPSLGKKGAYSDITNLKPFVSTLSAFYEKNMMWTGYPLITSPNAFSTRTRMKFRVDRAFASYPGPGDNPLYQFTTNGFEATTADSKTAINALGKVRVVPNPYYGFSEYERDQLDKRVKITNLPSRCVIRIFNLTGSLIRTIQHDQSTVTTDNSITWEDWNLQTDENLPIAGGVYIIHVDAGALGTSVQKWFGAMRPTDLNGNTY